MRPADARTPSFDNARNPQHPKIDNERCRGAVTPDAAADRCELILLRTLLTLDAAEPLEQVAVLGRLSERIARRLQHQIDLAYDHGATDAQVAHALRLSRQAARQRRLRRPPSRTV
jgi:hypothetical protein